MFSIYTLVRHPEKAYPKTIEGKLEALDFDLVLASPTSFKSFYDFIEEHSSYNKPYLELYVLSKLYQEHIDAVMNDLSSPTFERDCEELERLKEKLLGIVITNQRTHFNFDTLIRKHLERSANNTPMIVRKHLDGHKFMPSNNFNDTDYSHVIEPRESNVGTNLARLSLGTEATIDIKSFLPTFQVKPDSSSGRQVSYIDFTLCINKSKQ